MARVPHSQSSTCQKNLSIKYLPLAELTLDPRNPRRHSKKQIKQICASIRQFGFNVPVLIDAQCRIIAGHGRVQAARLLGLVEIPTICLDDLSPEHARAFMLADNKLTENAEWDDRLLAEHFKELSELCLDFSLEDTGFEMAQIDLLIEGLEPATEGVDAADQIPDLGEAVPVTQPGDLWLLGKHRVCCGDARRRSV